MNTQERIKEYFDTHPDATECYEALGKVFAEKEKAQKYLAGVAGRCVTTHSREGLEFERESDRMQHEIYQQENHVNDMHLAYENATSIDKQAAMGQWVAAKETLHKMNSRLEKQLILEEKDELLAKEEKPVPENLTKKELSAEELRAKVSSQQQIVNTNEKLIPKMTKAKQKTAKKTQASEIKLLEQLKADLIIAEDKEAAAALIPPAVETPVEDAKEAVDHEVTQEDLDTNPDLVEAGVKVGDTIQVPKKEDTATESGTEHNNGSSAATE